MAFNSIVSPKTQMAYCRNAYSAKVRMSGKHLRQDVVKSSEPTQVQIIRLVLNGAPKPDAAQKILLDAFKTWPEDITARFLMTPGGMIEAPWPKEFKSSTGWDSQPEDVKQLVTLAAEKQLHKVLTPAVLKAAKGKTQWITLGIDVLSEEGLKKPHVELVAVFDVAQNKIVGWTGKSFPTASQAKQLVQVSDLGSHFMKLGNQQVLILGCNDLNLFSPRVAALVGKNTPRGKMVMQMTTLMKRFRPTVVLQHPHATDSPNIWRGAWCHLQNMFSHVNVWASAIRYFNPNGKPRKPQLKVLQQTQSNALDVFDMEMDMTRYTSKPSRYMNSLKRF